MGKQELSDPICTSSGPANPSVGRLQAMLDALGYGAQRIIGGEDWQADIGELLARLGSASEVSRVTLFEAHPGPDGNLVESCRFDWAEPGLAHISGDPRYQNMPITDENKADKLDDWSARRQRGEIVAARFRDTTGYTRAVFEQHGTLSFISVPIHIGTEWWGFLGFDDCKTEREWGELEVELLRAAAAMVAGAIRRSRIQDMLRASEERYSLAVRGTEEGLWDWDIGMASLYVSPRVCSILPYESVELTEMQELSAALLPDDDGNSLMDHLADCFAASRERFAAEYRVRNATPSGFGETARWVAARGLIVYCEGRADRVVGTISDITARKCAEIELISRERMLEASRRLLREVVDAVPAVINVKDLQSRYLLMNRFQGALYGVEPQDAIGHTSAEFVGETYGGQSSAMDRIVIETGHPLPFSERDFIDVEGRAHTWYTAKLPLADIEGKPEGVVTVALDITQLKAMERARAHLARYVTPAVAESLASSTEPFGPPREQDAAILFADIVNSSRLFIEWPPHKVFALLRDVHAIMARIVFESNGTLDKFIGDGVMATFGTPFGGPRDASNGLACAHAIQESIGVWNRHRLEAGEKPVRIAIGVHYGPVIMGNMGDEQRMEFAVIGDTVNVASRLERLARPLNAAIVFSDDLIAAVAREAETEPATAEPLLEGLVKCEPQPIAGRDDPVSVRILPYDG